MKIITLGKLAGEGMANLRARSGMGLTAITIITLAFVVLGLFLVLFFNLNSLGTSLAQKLQLRVFLTDGASIETVGESLRSLPGVEGLEFVSKAQALEELRKQLGERSELLDLVEENPLPHTYIVRVREAELIPGIAEEAKTIVGVEEVVYGRESLGKVLDFINTVSILSVVGMVIIFLATLFIVVNTIRLTVIARKEEIAIRKLVGATDAFIRAPFVFEGIFMGLASASLASLLADFTYRLVLERAPQAIPFLPILPREAVVPQVTLSLLGLGVLLGIVGSWVSVRKYLR
ncbi:MAG: ABC transporter permease [Firmicutes bacterium]|nr:ABC transporter permease [Bacillota bacterium]